MVRVQPGGGSIQRRILSGVNIASHTSRRGALNARVRTMVASVGVEICSSLGGVGEMAFMARLPWRGRLPPSHHRHMAQSPLLQNFLDAANGEAVHV